MSLQNTAIQYYRFSTHFYSGNIPDTSDLLKLSLPPGMSVAQADEHGYGIRPVTGLGNSTSIFRLRPVFVLLDEGPHTFTDRCVEIVRTNHFFGARQTHHFTNRIFHLSEGETDAILLQTLMQLD